MELVSYVPTTVFAQDESWNLPLVTNPTATKALMIKTEFAERGLIVSLGTNTYMWCHSLNYWCNIVSREIQIQTAAAIGNENASVNYHIAFYPYVNFILKHSVESQPLPSSICVGSRRLEMGTDENGDIVFVDSKPLTPMGAGVNAIVAGLCFCPVMYKIKPVRFRPNTRGAITEYLAPLFNDPQEYETLQWLVGNCIRDPVDRSKFIMLFGPGGTGKSTLINIVLACMKGASMSFDDNVFNHKRGSAINKVKNSLVSNRLLTSSDVSFEDGLVNMHAIKVLTGGDAISIEPLQVKAICSVMVATNGMPTPYQEEWLSTAIMRRTVVVPMVVDTSAFPLISPPLDEESRLGWLLECVHVRTKHNHVPMTTRSILITLCGSAYTSIMEDIYIDPNATIIDSLDATALLGLSLGISMKHLGMLLNAMCPSSIKAYGGVMVLQHIALTW